MPLSVKRIYLCNYYGNSQTDCHSTAPRFLAVSFLIDLHSPGSQNNNEEQFLEFFFQVQAET